MAIDWTSPASQALLVVSSVDFTRTFRMLFIVSTCQDADATRTRDMGSQSLFEQALGEGKTSTQKGDGNVLSCNSEGKKKAAASRSRSSSPEVS